MADASGLSRPEQEPDDQSYYQQQQVSPGLGRDKWGGNRCRYHTHDTCTWLKADKCTATAIRGMTICRERDGS